MEKKEEFMEKLAGAIENWLGAGYTVSFQQVEKNNGLRREGVTICVSGIAIRMDIGDANLPEYIKFRGMDIQEAGRVIAQGLKNNPKFKMLRKVYERLDKRYILDNVFYQVINRESNAARLETVPYKEILDLAAVYRLCFRETVLRGSSILLNRKICEKYGISREELDSAARENTDGHFCVQTLSSLMEGLGGMPEKECQDGAEVPMWVITNQAKENGAAILLYKEYFDRLARGIGGDLYILPSSIHDVVAVPAEGMELDLLKTMVCDINARTVEADEILSMNIYRYSRERGTLEIAIVPAKN